MYATSVTAPNGNPVKGAAGKLFPTRAMSTVFQYKLQCSTCDLPTAAVFVNATLQREPHIATTANAAVVASRSSQFRIQCQNSPFEKGAYWPSCSHSLRVSRFEAAATGMCTPAPRKFNLKCSQVCRLARNGSASDCQCETSRCLEPG
jgi:hypothetical protein